MEEVTKSDASGTVRERSIMHSARVHGALTFVLVILAVFLLAQSMNAFKEYRYIGADVPAMNTISVQGEGEVFAAPDTARFTFSVMADAATAGEATNAVQAKADAILAALKEGGVSASDIKTTAYNLQPKYTWEPAVCPTWQPDCSRKRVQDGYTLNESMQVKVRDLSKAGDMLGVATENGADSVSGLSFTIADEDSVREEARKKAIEQAKEKARVLASDLEVSLGRIVNFNESGGYPIPYMKAAVMDEAAGLGGGPVEAPSVSAGENQITSTVTITYEIR